MAESRNCVWLCDICISSNIFTTDAKLTSVLESVKNKISTVLENAIPKVIEKVAEKEYDSVAIQRCPLKINESNDNIRRERDDSMKLIVTGVPESGDSTNSRIDNDFTEIDGVLNHIGLNTDGNVVSFRRLGKSRSQGGESRKCRPLLITCESPHFLSRCFSRSLKLQGYKHPVYLMKFLSSSEREIKKKILQKRYDIIHREGKNKSDFRIKKLKLYYKGDIVPVMEVPS